MPAPGQSDEAVDLEGNSDAQKVHFVQLEPIQTSRLRIYPVSWQLWPALRLEVFAAGPAFRGEGSMGILGRLRGISRSPHEFASGIGAMAFAAKGARAIRASLLERFFARYEFHCKYQVSCSDCESWTTQEVLDRAEEKQKALWQSGSLRLSYTESLGSPALLQKVYQNYRAKIAQERVRQNEASELPELYEELLKCKQPLITACVPVEGIFAVMSQLLEEDDVVIVMTPAYQALYEIARSRGCQVLSWAPRYDERGFWDFRVSDFEALVEGLRQKQRLSMVVLNSPHNPTGAVLDQQDFDTISDLLQGLDQETGPVLFSDEMYSGIVRQAPSNVGKKNSIVLSGLSKPWGMPGLRMGWLLVENPSHFERIVMLRDFTTLCLPPHAEFLSTVALQDPEFFLERNREIARRNYELLQKFLLSLPDWFHPLNQHQQKPTVDWRASTVFARLKHPLGSIGASPPECLQSTTHLAEYLASEHQVCMIVSDFFEFEHPAVRFGIGLKSFPDSLEQLERALSSIKAKAA
ncbi:unnamed protein product [Effrenium voratum]|nr:unnamed protein product [Effrenium voratum]